MPKIDWTKPIETVPCDRNPVPVPCEAYMVDVDGVLFGVYIKGHWFDVDGENEGCAGSFGPWAWVVDTLNGAFLTLDGAVRNVAESDT